MQAWVTLFEAWHPHGCCALDVGGRDGVLGKMFSPCSYTVLEQESDVIGGTDAVSCDILNCTSVAPCSFDLITMQNVLEHIVDPKAAVGTVGGLLRPGGMFMVWSPWIWRYHAQPTYGDYWRFSTRALEVLCIAAGMNPVISFTNTWKLAIRNT